MKYYDYTQILIMKVANKAIILVVNLSNKQQLHRQIVDVFENICSIDAGPNLS